MLMVKVDRPIQSVVCQDSPGLGSEQAHAPVDQEAVAQMESVTQQLDQQKMELLQTSQQLEHMLKKVCQYYEDLRSTHQKEIARLAVEIARKILARQVREGDYEIEAIITEALSKTPLSPDVVVYVHPEDLPQCEKLQQANQECAFSKIMFKPDRSIGKAECMIETPKGIIKSLIEEHLERVQEALNKAH